MTISGFIEAHQLADLPTPPTNALWHIYYEMYLPAIWIHQEKVGIFFYYLII